jgi:hypothetical protein
MKAVEKALTRVASTGVLMAELMVALTAEPKVD